MIFGDCSNQTIRTINFQLKDSQGNDINLHGNNWSFSIIFSRMEKIYSFFYYVIFTKYYVIFTKHYLYYYIQDNGKSE